MAERDTLWDRALSTHSAASGHILASSQCSNSSRRLPQFLSEVPAAYTLLFFLLGLLNAPRPITPDILLPWGPTAAPMHTLSSAAVFSEHPCPHSTPFMLLIGCHLLRDIFPYLPTLSPEVLFTPPPFGGRCLLQSMEIGTGQLLLNSWAPQGVTAKVLWINAGADRCVFGLCPSSWLVSGAHGLFDWLATPCSL